MHGATIKKFEFISQ